jgi:hypothetical protein
MMLATICKAIGDAMLHFLEQNVLLQQQLVLFALHRTPLGDVFHAEQNRGACASLVKHLAGIQAHRAVAELWKFVLDLIVLHRAAFQDDFFQEHAQFWNVPLPISQRIEKSPLGVLGSNVECGVKRTARGDDPQMLVENEDRLSYGVDDGLSEGARIRDVRKLFPEIDERHEDLPRPESLDRKPTDNREKPASQNIGYLPRRFCSILIIRFQRPCGSHVRLRDGNSRIGSFSGAAFSTSSPPSLTR